MIADPKIQDSFRAKAIRVANASWAGNTARLGARAPAKGVSQVRDAGIAMALGWVEPIVAHA